MNLTHKKRIEAAKNVLYRKAMEDLRDRINVKQVNNEKDYIKYTSKPNYMSYLNKPAHIGMCILDLSKVLMYKFHYDYIKKKI